MQNVFLFGAIMGIGLYLSKLGLFYTLAPTCVKRWTHNSNLMLGIMDIVLGYTILHMTAIAGGYLSLIVTSVFGMCSMLYIYSRIGLRKVKEYI